MGLSVTVIFSVILVKGTHIVKTLNYTIKCEVPNKFKFIHISDIHGKTGFLNGKVSNIINKLSPDFVVVTGDCANNYKRFPEVIRNLGMIKSPIYMVLGNYEREESKGILSKKTPIAFEKILNEIKKYDNITLLINKHEIIKLEDTKILVFGFDNSKYGNERYNKYVDNIEYDYKILLAHSPNIMKIVEDNDIKYNHILVGHTHGGQINIPSLFKNPYNRFHIGLRKINENQYFSINPGLGTVRIPFRINSMPEITIYNVGEN